jgi:Contractile injection system tube protein
VERVAFLIERTGERITCLLNPQNLETRRSAGIRMRREAGGFLAGRARTDHPLLATGGGTTELDLHLLFDTGVAASERGAQAALQAADGTDQDSEDVRTMTRPLWDLAENAFSDGFGAPPCVRFIWGKSWNMPGVVVHVAERLEQFDANGAPQRSWLSLRLRRVEEPEPRPAPPMPVTPQFEPPDAPAGGPGDDTYPAVTVPVDDDGTPLNRLDQIAGDHYGNPELARPLGDFNGLDDLLKVDEGTTLILPPIAQLWSRA